MTRSLAALAAMLFAIAGCAGSAASPEGAGLAATSVPSSPPASTVPRTTSSPPASTAASAPSASPSGAHVVDPASPDAVSPTGCDDSGNCRIVEVGLWHAVPFTPSIRCGLAEETCQLHFEIYAPTSGGPWPLIVLEPGGNIEPDQPGDYLDQMATALAGSGAVVMVGQWRQSDRWAGGSPDSFADVACAIGVARRIGPAFGANPDRVVLAGHSMATRPVAVVGLTAKAITPAAGSCDATAGSLRPDAWADLAGPLPISSGDLENVAFFGGTKAADPAAWAAGDPFALAAHRAVRATDLPIVLIQGGADSGAADARAFQAALVAGRYHSRLVEIADADHFGTTVARASIEAIFALTSTK